jgi:hypothetical protein
MRTENETQPERPQPNAYSRTWGGFRPSHAQPGDNDRVVLRITNPATGAHIEVTDPHTGDISRVALQHLEALGFYHQLLKDEALAALNRTRREPGAQMITAAGLAQHGDRYTAASGTPGDGTPYLRWVPARTVIETPVWQLTLHGAATVTLNQAAWDDATGIAALVGQLADEATLQTLLILTDADAGAAMARRLSVRALRAAGTLPTMNPATIWQALNDAGLATGETESWKRGVVKALQINTGDSRVTVAIAVSKPISVHRSERGVTYQSRCAEWEAAVDAAVTADSAWRTLDLPAANKFRRNSTQAFCLYTRIPADQWPAVDAAAQDRLATFDLKGGRTL